MLTDAERCKALCELIDTEPETSPLAETYVRLLWEVLDRQMFAVPKGLCWRRVEGGMIAAA